VSIGSELKGVVAPAKEGVREEEQARGRREMTRGGRGSRRWNGSNLHSGDGERRRAARQMAGWRGTAGRSQNGTRGRGGGLRRHVAQPRAARGSRASGNMAGEGSGAAQRDKQRRRREVDEGGPG
jgi:hypothetical protein